jgi:tRNA nucleotidyltransferase (CCA-adding enzyme)
MPDYMFLLQSRLSAEQSAALVRVQEAAQDQSVNVYLTGGAVRDLISGAPIRDLDFTVEGNTAAMLRELEKGGARRTTEDAKLREAEVVFPGEVDASISAAREEIYELPGSRPDSRWATIMEDLRRRDFSINAVAISLNPASRGLLLDPTNGLADIERREVRALSIHCFTNQPARLLRILRFAARLDFQIEARTKDWFDRAIERGLDKQIPVADVGRELRHLGNEAHPAAIVKSWESHGLLSAIDRHLVKHRPDYDSLGRLARAHEQMSAAGLKLRLFGPVISYLLRGLSSHERALLLHKAGLSSGEAASVAKLESAARDAVKALKGRQTESPLAAYRFLDSLERDVMAFVLTEHTDVRVHNKIRNYLQRWRPLRLALPAAELEALGVARGPQFDLILEQLFELQLRGKGKTAIDRTRLLRQLAGIKPEPKKSPEKKPAKGKAKTAAEKAPAPAKAAQPAAAQKHEPASRRPAAKPDKHESAERAQKRHARSAAAH